MGKKEKNQPPPPLPPPFPPQFPPPPLPPETNRF